MEWQTILIGLLGGAFASVLSFLGLRYQTRSAKESAKAQVEVDQRKVDQEAFNAYMEQNRKDLDRLRERMIDAEAKQEATEQKLEQTQLRLIIAVVNLKKTRQAVLDGKELPPFPDELKSVSTWTFDDVGSGSE
jgi:hypothetical protein